MFGVETDTELVGCPYDKAHRVLRKHLQTHLLRCRMNHPEVELQKCPFNVTHLIPEPEYVSHITTCPDRKVVTHYKYQREDNIEEFKEKGQPKHNAFEEDENWNA